MKIVFNNENVELKYTFNSFKYMEELDISDMQLLEKKPFKMLPLASMLLLGALNNDPLVVYVEVDVEAYLETQLKKGDIIDIFEKLVKLLEESDFFKSLQAKSKEQK